MSCSQFQCFADSLDACKSVGTIDIDEDSSLFDVSDIFGLVRSKRYRSIQSQDDLTQIADRLRFSNLG